MRRQKCNLIRQFSQNKAFENNDFITDYILRLSEDSKFESRYGLKFKLDSIFKLS